MLSSRGEIKIHEILEDAGFNFKEEYIFPDLRSSNGRPLRFDFAVFDDDGNIDFLIEYQGRQHYEASQNLVALRVYTNSSIMIIKKEDFVRFMVLLLQKFHTLKKI